MSPEDCYKVYPVERTVSSTEAIGTVAVNKLLEGPTEEEKSEGYFTSLPEGVVLSSLRVEEGAAYADFNEVLNEGGGSCSMMSRATQINETLEQFPTVDEVIISVNGDVETALQP
jgi:germination protein M